MSDYQFDTTIFLKGISILVIDGEKLSLKLIEDTLRTFGFTQIKCVDDENEVEEVISNKSYGIIITDWKIGNFDVGGFVKKMRADKTSPNRYTPVILITGRGALKEVKEARDSGVTEFMLKPFSVKILREKLIEIIEHPRNFIISRNFIGPDRRRKVVEVKDDKRKK